MKKVKAVTPFKIVPLQKTNPLAIKGYDSLIDDWLARFLSEQTRRVYLQVIDEFFAFIKDKVSFEQVTTDPHQILIQFLLLEQTQAYEWVAHYEGWLIKKDLTAVTINRKLASIKSLVNYASEVGKCFYTLSNIKTKPVTKYRDTTGISTEAFKQMLATVDRSTLLGKRDYAILLLLWGNALRRNEVRLCKVKDFKPKQKRLGILGKGKQAELQQISLGKETIKAIEEWLKARGKVDHDQPLFCAVQSNYYGHRLNPHSIYKLVQKYAKLAGIEQTLSPHRLRHSAITAALDATNGDVRAVQKLSRHSSLNTLMVYDDNRRNEQGRVTDLLEDLL